jgi:multicomponent Na+:H+ antiporter subunit D
MVISAAGHEKMAIPWLLLTFVSSATFIYAGIKVPVAAFFGGESPAEAKEPPLNMRLAMGITAFLCLFIGIFPGILYHLLPYSPVHYAPYTGAHIVAQLQLMMFGGLAFYFLFISGHYPAEARGINLDTDWFYRKGGRLFYRFVDKALNGVNALSNRFLVRNLSAKLGQWSRVPVTSLVTLYLKVAGRDTLEIEQSPERPRPETENLIPMGVPVFLSFIGLFFVLILFIALV